VLVAVAISKRLFLSAWRLVCDARQMRAFAEYRAQYSQCDFVPHSLADAIDVKLLPIDAICPVDIFVVVPGTVDAERPAALTAFFFLSRKPIILSPFPLTTLNTFQRYLLLHELGHAYGIQRSHQLQRISFTLSLAYAAAMMIWCGVTSNIAVYVYMSYCIVGVATILRLLSKRRGQIVEAFADLFAREALQRLESDVDIQRVCKLQRLVRAAQHAPDDDALVDKYMELHENARRQELLDMQRSADERGEVPVIVVHRLLQGFEHRMAQIDGQLRLLADRSGMIDIILFVMTIACMCWLGWVTLAPSWSSSLWLSWIFIVVAWYSKTLAEAEYSKVSPRRG
jgi:hypothetical protein